MSEPYVCPKCHGEGTEDGSKRWFNPTVVSCWTCGGTGILWREKSALDVTTPTFCPPIIIDPSMKEGDWRLEPNRQYSMKLESYYSLVAKMDRQTTLISKLTEALHNLWAFESSDGIDRHKDLYQNAREALAEAWEFQKER